MKTVDESLKYADDFCSSESYLVCLATEVRRLREENELLKVGAERYRWLRDAGATFYTGGPEITDGSDKVHVCEFAMDAAIDAANRHCAILPFSCK